MDLGLLILRLVVGFTLFAHGAQKMFGWFGGGGVAGTQTMVRRLGFHPVEFWALTVMLGETGGGLLVALGFLSPLGNFGIGAAMAVAIRLVHWPKGFFNSKGGYEFPLVNLAAVVALGFTGPGRYSLDRLFGISAPEPAFGIVLAILVVAALGLGISTRQPAPQTPSR